MIRRLPIYFLIDVSESMVGEPMALVEEGIASIIKDLKSDPYALETVHICIIVFAGQSRTLVPLTDIINFYPPKFPVGGGTSLANGLGQLMYELRKNTVKTTPDVKGDWKPIIFLFTDGVPTNDSDQAIKEWKNNWAAQANFIAVSFGDSTDLRILNDLTENVIMLKSTTVQSYKHFFKWVTASIKMSSISVENNGSGFDLAKADEEILAKIDLTKEPLKLNYIDSNYAVFIAKCQNSKKPYLIKYKQKTAQSNISNDLNLSTRYYRLVGGYAVENTYFELAGETSLNQKISTDELEGFPACPCCGNQWGFSVCSCGKVHCSGNESITVCPWCGNRGVYSTGSNPLDINRTQG